MGVGWFELIALGVALLVGVLFSAITLRLACWIANRILPATPISPDARAAEEAGPTYRTVEAGPFTSPATAQMDPSGPPRDQEPAVPEPHFLHAAGIAALGMIVGGVAVVAWMLGAETILRTVPMNDGYAKLLMRDLGALGCFAGMQYVASVLLLPTSLLRALLVTFLHLVGLVLLAVGSSFLIGMGIHALTPRETAQIGMAPLGLLSLVMALAFGTLFSSVSLRVACWLANRVLAAKGGLGDADEAEAAAVVYRTVDAGPFTSPATAQRDADPAPGEAAIPVPEPSFLQAASLAALGLFCGLAATFLLLFFVPRVLFSWVNFDNPPEVMLVIGAETFLCVAVVQYFVTLLLLPTSALRCLLVTCFHCVGLALLTVVSGILITLVVLGFTPG